MAVTGYKIYVTGNIAYIDEIVDSGSAMQFEGLAKNCLPRKKYTNSTEFSFSGFNGLDETKAFPFAQLKDGNGDAWADQATFEAWATSNLGKPSAGDSALIYEGYLTSQTDTDAPVVSWIGADGGITLAYVSEGGYAFQKTGLFDSSKVFFDTTPFEGLTTTALFTLIPSYEAQSPDALFIRCQKFLDAIPYDNEINQVRFRITIKP